MIDTNIVPYSSAVTREQRAARNGHSTCVLWFTGLSGAGKSTLAHAVEEALYLAGYQTFVLDGDNVRQGLCADLGFSHEHRRENIRRIAETAKLMTEAGLIAITAFISPFQADRARARKLFPPGDFLEIYCSASIDICKARDVKGFYQKARDREINNYTGIDSPYEQPEQPELVVDTGQLPLETCVDMVMNLLAKRGIGNNIQPPSAGFTLKN